MALGSCINSNFSSNGNANWREEASVIIFHVFHLLTCGTFLTTSLVTCSLVFYQTGGGGHGATKSWGFRSNLNFALISSQACFLVKEWHVLHFPLVFNFSFFLLSIMMSLLHL